LGKHRLKLTGSNWGDGVHHPVRWTVFVKNRYVSSRILIEADRLPEFSFSVLPVSDQDRSKLKGLEAQVYCAVSKVVGEHNMLNDRSRVKRSKECEAAKMCPFKVQFFKQ
jgi:hypothetical protein